MAGFKQPDFIERQEAAAKARKDVLEKFRAKMLIRRWRKYRIKNANESHERVVKESQLDRIA
jgi:hypothetical protein